MLLVFIILFQKKAFYISNFRLFCFRHDDLKLMLDTNRDSLKLEAMKRIIGVSVIKWI